MTCAECGGEQSVLAVPEDLRELLPEGRESMAVCTRCLRLEPADGVPGADPELTRISDAFPTGDAGVAMALAVGLLDSLALYRDELAALLERVEHGGTDPLLVLDRLDADPEVEPHFDLDRRRTQVEQLVYG